MEHEHAPTGRFLARVIDNTDPDSLDIMDGLPGFEFDDARQAWAWLRDLRATVEDDFPGWNIGEYTQTLRDLEYAATECEFGSPHEDWPLTMDGAGKIVGSTPGVGDREGDGDVEDVGITYEVVAV